jgi:hypothetical protein
MKRVEKHVEQRKLGTSDENWKHWTWVNCSKVRPK